MIRQQIDLVARGAECFGERTDRDRRASFLEEGLGRHQQDPQLLGRHRPIGAQHRRRAGEGGQSERAARPFRQAQGRRRGEGAVQAHRYHELLRDGPGAESM